MNDARRHDSVGESYWVPERLNYLENLIRETDPGSRIEIERDLLSRVVTMARIADVAIRRLGQRREQDKQLVREYGQLCNVARIGEDESKDRSEGP